MLDGDGDGDGKRSIRFAMVNTTDTERSVTWRDVELQTADGRRVECFWGDDSYPRYPTLPGERTVTYRSCEVPDTPLRLYYRGIEVAKG